MGSTSICIKRKCVKNAVQFEIGLIIWTTSYIYSALFLVWYMKGCSICYNCMQCAMLMQFNILSQCLLLINDIHGCICNYSCRAYNVTLLISYYIQIARYNYLCVIRLAFFCIVLAFVYACVYANVFFPFYASFIGTGEGESEECGT